ncbi:hypothetical protein ACQP2E_12075 [Actinoplanes sp. CA-015351]|uniref:hypothetical protein n=1 Tax=Actinoplanes sp. CA-015351 TaxID=3239897 RepID=UPI003D95D067
MSAMDTALRVLIWATATDESRGPAPTGALSDVADLAAPPPVLRRAVARTAAVTAARMMLDAPPLGGRAELGCEPILVAAAVGAPGDSASLELLRAAGQPAGGYDLLARHAVVEPAVREGVGSAGFRAALLAASPLTALLDHPGGAPEMVAEDTLDDLLFHPQGRVTLIRHLSRPPATPEQSLWRGSLLQRLRPGEPALVLDVYETALGQHRPALVEQVRFARRGLSFGGVLDTGRVAPVAKWWQALSYLERGRGATALKSRFGLRDYAFGLDLYRTAWRLGMVK